MACGAARRRRRRGGAQVGSDEEEEEVSGKEEKKKKTVKKGQKKEEKDEDEDDEEESDAKGAKKSLKRSRSLHPACGPTRLLRAVSGIDTGYGGARLVKVDDSDEVAYTLAAYAPAMTRPLLSYGGLPYSVAVRCLVLSYADVVCEPEPCCPRHSRRRRTMRSPQRGRRRSGEGRGRRKTTTTTRGGRGRTRQRRVRARSLRTVLQGRFRYRPTRRGGMRCAVLTGAVLCCYQRPRGGGGAQAEEDPKAEAAL